MSKQRLNQLSSNQRNVNADDEILQTSNYGGLNTVSSRLNIPLEDSPDLLNVTINEKGNVAKRLGSQVLRTVSGLFDTSGTTIIPITFKNLKSGCFIKEGKTIRLCLYESNKLVEVVSKNDVWTNAAASVRADYTITSETEPRIILTTGINVPVQVTIVEASGKTTTSGSYSFVDERFKYANTSSIVVWRNQSRLVSGVSFSYSSGTVTISHSSIAVGDIIDVVYVSWQWWAEAVQLEGDQLHYHTTRFHVNATDQNIAISSRITSNILPISHGFYPILVYKSSNFNSLYIRSLTRKPTNSDEYAFSTGGRYNALSGDELLPGTQYITFGDILPYSGSPPAPAKPEPVHFIRGIKLPFRGDRGQSGNNLKVIVDENATYVQNTTLAASGTHLSNPTYYLRDENFDVITDGSTVATYITFDSMATIGLPQTAFVEIINAEVVSTNVGSAATSNTDEFRDGALVPAYGLGMVADYFRGSFPRTVTIYQGRLVFGGFPTAPMTVLLSNVFDSVRPGKLFSNYQTVFEKGLVSDALDVLITNTLDDFITGLIEFQNQLFVFTRNALYRIHGGQSGLVTPTNVFLNSVASIGAVNPQSICRVDKTVFFLSSSGVYDITPTIEAGDYTTAEKSIKIRNMLKNSQTPYNESTAWLVYDRNSDSLYCAVSGTDTPYAAQRMYVYSTLREAWTLHTSLGGVLYTIHGCFLSNGVSVFASLPDYRMLTASPNSITYITINKNKYLDFCNIHIGSGTGAFTIQTNVVYRKAIHTTAMVQTTYSTRLSVTNPQGFDMSDVTSLVDASVTLDGVPLQHGTHWVKTHNSEIVLLVPPGNGKTLVIIHTVPNTNELPIRVYRDNIKLKQGTHYTISEDSASKCYRLSFPSCVNNAVYVYGALYVSYHKSPFFVRGLINNIKQMKYYTGYFDNTAGQETYTALDANIMAGQSPEEIAGLYKTQINCNVAFLYDELDEGFNTESLYKFDELYWDVSYFDVSNPSKQYKRFAKFVEPIVGLNYGFQVQVWSVDYFELAGYQVSSKIGGHSSLSNFE